MMNIKLLCFMEALIGIAVGLFYLSLNRPARALIKPGYIIALMLIPVIGLFGGNKNVFYIAMFLLPLFAIGNPQRLACLYVATLPMFPALGEAYTIGSAFFGEFSAVHALNLGALLALLLLRRIPNTSRPAPELYGAVWLFFFVALFTAASGLPSTGVLRLIFSTALTVLPPFFVMVRGVRTPKAAGDVAQFLLLGAVCNAVIATFEATRTWPLYFKMYETLHVPYGLSATLSIRSGFLRAQAAIGNPATLSVLMALGIVTCLALRDRLSRVGFFALLTVMSIALICSQSRGGWVAVVVGVAIFWLFQRRYTLLALFGGVASAVAAAILILPSEGQLGQLLGRSGNALETAEYRSSLLSRGLEEVRKHPWSGYTRDQLEVVLGDLRQGEQIIDFVNSHLYVLLRLGIIGFVLWLVAWATPLWFGWRSRARLPQWQLDPRFSAALAMIVICFVGLTFTSMIDRMIPFAALSFGLVAAMSAQPASRRLKAVPESRTTIAQTPVTIVN